MVQWLSIAVGGALGAVSRHAVNVIVIHHFDSVLLGTFLVNVSGSFVLGLMAGADIPIVRIPDQIRMLLAVGFLGSYTTFSTLTVGSIRFMVDGDPVRAGLNVLGSVAIGLVAAWLGLIVGRTF